MDLISRHYGMEYNAVYLFDLQYLLPLINKLNESNNEYFICHSHYLNHPKVEFPNHTTLRIYGPEIIINNLIEFEINNLNKFGYKLFDKDEEKKRGKLSIEILAKNKHITIEEMLKVFNIWDQTSRLKVMLLDLWMNGKGNSWNEGVHYALNSFGLVQNITLQKDDFKLYYKEEEEFTKRNFPNRE